MVFGWVPFSVEKRVHLFSRALLEVIEGWRLLAPTASTRSMSGCRSTVYCCVCYTCCTQHDIFDIHTGNTVHASSTLRWFCIRCSIRLLLSVSRSLPNLRIESDIERTVRVLFSLQFWAYTARCCLPRCRTYRCCCCAAAAGAAESAR